MAKGDSLADQLFNRDTVTQLGNHFERAGIFDAGPFVADVMAELQSHELKARISFIAIVLGRYLPQDFPQAASAIQAALPPPLNPHLQDDDFGHFIYATLGVYVENEGLTDHFSTSLDLLEALTQRFSMEFSIRAFLNHNQDATLDRMAVWAKHDNYHVRRLASEGTRPRLPWGHNVGLTTNDTLPILDDLHADPTRFVTRSVANHLNDIAKTDVDAVVDRLERWQKLDRQSAKELDWIKRHALRGAVKAGHPRAMAHLGYDPDVALSSATIVVPKHIKMGDKVPVAVKLTPAAPSSLMIDYVIDFVKSRGNSAPKVFKIKSLKAKTNVEVSIEKTHYFDNTATTFRMYAGQHRIHLQVNGRIVASQNFTLS